MRVRVADDDMVTVLNYTTMQSQDFGVFRNTGPGVEVRPKIVEALLETLRTLGCHVQVLDHQSDQGTQTP